MFVQVKRVVYEVDGQEVSLSRGDVVPESMPEHAVLDLLHCGAVGPDDPDDALPEPEVVDLPAPAEAHVEAEVADDDPLDPDADDADFDPPSSPSSPSSPSHPFDHDQED